MGSLRCNFPVYILVIKSILLQACAAVSLTARRILVEISALGFFVIDLQPSAAYSRQLLVEIDDLQLLVLVHPSHVHVHVRRELGFLRAVWTLVSRFLAALELAVRLHVGEPGVAAVASGAMELLPHDRSLHDHAVRPASRRDRRHSGFLTMSRIDVKICALLRAVLHRVQTVSSGLIRFRGHAAAGHYLGMYVRRRVHLPVKRI